MHLENERSLKSNRVRALSEHVVSRWYRPPEIILCDHEYWFSADIWSAGCIFAEMIKFSELIKKKHSKLDERILLNGKSCYPMSPCYKNEMLNIQGENIVGQSD